MHLQLIIIIILAWHLLGASPFWFKIGPELSNHSLDQHWPDLCATIVQSKSNDKDIVNFEE